MKAMNWQWVGKREIGDRHGVTVDDAAQFAHFLMGSLEEFVKQPELVHQFQRGRMNGVATKIAQEIGMFFQDDDLERRRAREESRASFPPGRLQL